jgi:sugar O-acyltransferase (sialic acid O-acetyltransferase NeuD family)
MTPLVIIGAGGFGREVHDVVEAVNLEEKTAGISRFDFVGFLDDGPVDRDLIADRGPLLGGIDVLAELPLDVEYVIGIGSPTARRRIDELAGHRGAATLIHPTATIGEHRMVIGPGAIICSHVSITTNVTLGRHVHLNLNCTVGHDAILGDYVTVNPGATISGNVTLQDGVNIGTGAAVIQGKTVGAGSTIGAGASVVRDIPPGVTAVGVPARPR